LSSLLHDLGAEPQESMAKMHWQLNDILVDHSRSGRTVVVVVDEAQNLPDEVLESLRMLSNFETSSKKLMQIILPGQPQLTDKLGSGQLLQLRQRITINAHLEPLNCEETRQYVRHRLQVAGHDFKQSLFTVEAGVLI